MGHDTVQQILQRQSELRKNPQTVDRAKIASLVFSILAILNIGVVLPLLEIVDIPVTTLDVAISCISFLMSICAAIGLWRRRIWGWKAAMLSIALGILDLVRVTVMDPEFGLGGLGVSLLLVAAVLWTVDAQRLHGDISPPLPESGLLSARLYLSMAQVGLIFVIGALFGGLILVLSAVLMLSARARRGRGTTN